MLVMARAHEGVRYCACGLATHGAAWTREGRLDAVGHGRVRCGSMRCGLASRDGARCGVAWPRAMGLCAVWPGLARWDSVQCGPARWSRGP